MVRENDADLPTICGYAKSKYEARAEERRRKRSSSEPAVERLRQGPKKLHKAPQVQTLHERPRNRLRKQPLVILSPQVSANFFVLEYEPYPYNTQPSEFLGVYSSINSVTTGAFKHGAYTFSSKGLLDGSEYLSPTGRISFYALAVQRHGVKAPIVERSRSLDDEVIRLDIPHPESQAFEKPHTDDQEKEKVYLAIRKGPNLGSCIGLFVDKNLAWGACLKDKAMSAIAYALSDETRTIGLNNMPQVTGKLAGSGWHTWLVQEHVIDSISPSTTQRTSQILTFRDV